MSTRTLCLAMWPAMIVLLPTARGEFVDGHVYLIIGQVERCFYVQSEDVFDVDPETGVVLQFVSYFDGLCEATGPSFTPDGRYLWTVNGGNPFEDDNGYIMQFDAEGEPTVIYDETDGLYRPYGLHSSAFNKQGDFFVLNAGNAEILRFPADGSPAVVYADYEDGILGGGTFAFAPDGDLYYLFPLNIYPFATDIIRIPPEGDGEVFDTIENALSCLAIDRAGNIYVSTEFTEIYRYDAEQRDTLRLFSQSVVDYSEQAPITVTPDGQYLYLVEGWETSLYRFATVDGSVVSVIDLPDAGFPYGVTVYDASASEVCPGDVNDDGLIDPLDSGFVLSRFGCPVGTGDPDCDAADSNDDGAVDPLDNGYVLSRLGLCP